MNFKANELSPAPCSAAKGPGPLGEDFTKVGSRSMPVCSLISIQSARSLAVQMSF